MISQNPNNNLRRLKWSLSPTLQMGKVRLRGDKSFTQVHSSAGSHGGHSESQELPPEHHGIGRGKNSELMELSTNARNYYLHHGSQQGLVQEAIMAPERGACVALPGEVMPRVSPWLRGTAQVKKGTFFPQGTFLNTAWEGCLLSPFSDQITIWHEFFYFQLSPNLACDIITHRLSVWHGRNSG